MSQRAQIQALLIICLLGSVALWHSLTAPKYRGQFLQDRWVLEEIFPNTTDGFFLDVGAWDAEVGSNTKALEERGWNGVCIEPFPRNWKDRKCQLFTQPVWNEAGKKVTFKKAGVLGGIEDAIGLHKDTNEVSTAETVELTTTTLEDVLIQSNAPHFINYVSIDIEGAEYEALKAFPFARYSVGAFSVEHNHEESKREKIRALLISHGYRLAGTADVDDLYVRASASEEAAVNNTRGSHR